MEQPGAVRDGAGQLHGLFHRERPELPSIGQPLSLGELHRHVRSPTDHAPRDELHEPAPVAQLHDLSLRKEPLDQRIVRDRIEDLHRDEFVFLAVVCAVDDSLVPAAELLVQAEPPGERRVRRRRRAPGLFLASGLLRGLAGVARIGAQRDRRLEVGRPLGDLENEAAQPQLRAVRELCLPAVPDGVIIDERARVALRVADPPVVLFEPDPGVAPAQRAVVEHQVRDPGASQEELLVRVDDVATPEQLARGEDFEHEGRPRRGHRREAITAPRRPRGRGKLVGLAERPKTVEGIQRGVMITTPSAGRLDSTLVWLEPPL
jgi:hypothetical protein